MSYPCNRPLEDNQRVIDLVTFLLMVPYLIAYVVYGFISDNVYEYFWRRRY